MTTNHHVCAIAGCHARLLGFSYFALVLDDADGPRIVVCPSCFRKINAGRAEQGLPPIVGWRSNRISDAS